MTVSKIGEVTTVNADEGKAIRRVGAADTYCKTAFLAPNDSPENWEDCNEDGSALRYSRWGIIKALEKRGLADAFDSYLDSNKAAFRRFYGPQFFCADDADFKDMLKILAAAFKMTDADIAAILTESPYIED